MTIGNTYTTEKSQALTSGMQNLAVYASRSSLARISFFATGEWKSLRKAKLCIPKTLQYMCLVYSLIIIWGFEIGIKNENFVLKKMFF